MTPDFIRFMQDMKKHEQRNHEPAVDEPANDFERCVNEHP